jgi:hypothetical protein
MPRELLHLWGDRRLLLLLPPQLLLDAQTAPAAKGVRP